MKKYHPAILMVAGLLVFFYANVAVAATSTSATSTIGNKIPKNIGPGICIPQLPISNNLLTATTTAVFLQHALISDGYLIDSKELKSGKYGTSTIQAILSFQSKNKIKSTGGIDKETRDILLKRFDCSKNIRDLVSNFDTQDKDIKSGKTRAPNTAVNNSAAVLNAFSVNTTAAATTPNSNAFLNSAYVIDTDGSVEFTNDIKANFEEADTRYTPNHIYNQLELNEKMKFSSTYKALDTSPSPKYSINTKYSRNGKCDQVVEDLAFCYLAGKYSIVVDSTYNEKTGAKTFSASFCLDDICEDTNTKPELQSDPNINYDNYFWGYSFPSIKPSAYKYAVPAGPYTFNNLPNVSKKIIGSMNLSRKEGDVMTWWSYQGEDRLTLDQSWTEKRANHTALITNDSTGSKDNTKVELSFRIGNLSDSTGYYASAPAIPCVDISIPNSTSRVDPLNSEQCIVTVTAPINGVTDITPTVNPEQHLYSYKYDKPQLLCGHIQGDGPIKIVFQRGAGSDLSDSDWLNLATGEIKNGFNVVDPFRYASSSFSYYIDMKGHDDLAVATHNDEPRINDYTFNMAARATLTSASSCGMGNMHMFYTGLDLTIAPAYTPYSPPRNIIFFYRKNNTAISPMTAVHEFGHGFAALDDEYGYKVNARGSIANPEKLNEKTALFYRITENCSINPREDYKGVDGLMYGSQNSKGCWVYKADTGTMDVSGTFWSNPVDVYRPSEASIMNDTPRNFPSDNRFNVVSCGYIMSNLNGYPPDANFEECSKMENTIKAPPQPANLSGTLQVQGNSTNTFAPGSTITVNGTGFSGTDNSVELKLVNLSLSKATEKNNNLFASVWSSIQSLLGLDSGGSSAATDTEKITALQASLANSTDSGGSLSDPSKPLWFIVNGINSIDGKTLNFTVPFDTLPGAYDMRAAANNTNWGASTRVTVSGDVVPPPPKLGPLAVVYPNGGETLYMGQTQTFSFVQPKNESTLVYLDFTYHSNVDIAREYFIGMTTPNAQSITYSIPYLPVFTSQTKFPPGVDFKIRVCSVDKLVCDSSDNYFTIASPISAAVFSNKSDYAGELGIFAPGSYNGITNDFGIVLNIAKGVLGNKTIASINMVRKYGGIWYTANSKALPIVVFKNGIQVNNAYGDTIPIGPTDENLLLYVQQMGNGDTWGEGSVTITFTDKASTTIAIPNNQITLPASIALPGTVATTINKLPTVISPNGGEAWRAGSVYDVTFIQPLSTTTSIYLDKYANGGIETRLFVASINLGNQSYTYNIPTTTPASSYYKIRVCNPDGTCDSSDSYFSVAAIIPPVITLPHIDLISPNPVVTNQTITIIGTGFSTITPNQINISGQLMSSQLQMKSIDGLKLEFRLAMPAGNYDIQVKNLSTGLSNKVSVTVNAATIPVITASTTSVISSPLGTMAAPDSVEGVLTSQNKTWYRINGIIYVGSYVEDVLKGRLNQPQGRGNIGKVTAVSGDYVSVDFGRGYVIGLRISEVSLLSVSGEALITQPQSITVPTPIVITTPTTIITPTPIVTPSIPVNISSIHLESQSMANQTTVNPLPSRAPTLTSSMTSQTSDFAGPWGTFAPGDYGGNKNDWGWTINLDMNGNSKTVSDITINGAGGEAWSTSNGSYYALVVLKNGQQQNITYGQNISVGPNTETLQLYGQQVNTSWGGGNVVVTFTDGTKLNSTVVANLSAYLGNYNLVATVWYAIMMLIGR